MFKTRGKLYGLSYDKLLWKHWGIDVRGFRGSPLPTNLRVLEPLLFIHNF